MSKTKLTIPIDTATLVDAVKHTNFTQDEQRELLEALSGGIAKRLAACAKMIEA